MEFVCLFVICVCKISLKGVSFLKEATLHDRSPISPMRSAMLLLYTINCMLDYLIPSFSK
jgi:hypothetical protein